MKCFACLTGVVALAVPLATAQASTWRSDPAHSEVDFTIRHLSIADVSGSFGGVKATIIYDPSDPARCSVRATVGVGTVNTGEAGRDDEIKSSDFFGVDEYPTATFTSTSVTKDGADLKVVGNFTLHGVTRPVVLDVAGPTSQARGPEEKPYAGFSATATIDRTAFGIGTGFPSAILGDEVKLKIHLEVIRQ